MKLFNHFCSCCLGRVLVFHLSVICSRYYTQSQQEKLVTKMGDGPKRNLAGVTET